MRDYEVIIFGATGYTGKWVTEEFSKFSEGKKWAVCGRSEERLRKCLTDLEIETDILVADISVRLGNKMLRSINSINPQRNKRDRFVLNDGHSLAIL